MSTTLDFDADLASRIETIYATPDVNATRIAVSAPPRLDLARRASMSAAVPAI